MCYCGAKALPSISSASIGLIPGRTLPFAPQTPAARASRRAPARRADVPWLGAPTRISQRWSLDVVIDVLDDGRRFRILTVVDDFTRARLAIDVDTSIGGRRVVEVLQHLIDTRGKPAMLITACYEVLSTIEFAPPMPLGGPIE